MCESETMESRQEVAGPEGFLTGGGLQFIFVVLCF